MSLPDRIAEGISTHSRLVLVVLLATTIIVGAGMPMVDDDSSLDQFETDSPEAEAQAYLDENFTVEEAENTTTVQVITRGENVLTRESLLDSLEFQQEVGENRSISDTLVDEEPITGVENLVAMRAITTEELESLERRTADLEERGAELEARGEELEARGAELESEGEALEERAVELAEWEAELEAEAAELEAREEAFEAQLAEAGYGADDELPADLEAERAELEADQAALEAEREALSEANEALEADQAAFDAEQATFEDERADVEAAQDDLEEDQEALESDWDEFEETADERPSLDEQIEALEALDEDEFEELVEETLSGSTANETDTDTETNASGAPEDDATLSLLPTSYEPGSTTADARITSVTQSTEGAGVAEMGGFDEQTVEAQLDLRTLALDRATAMDQDLDREYVVFGFGIISDEIDRSMGDSLAVVGPLALLFVVLALAIAYRDPVDIVLGVAGIVTVLVWTFGFMGWTGIAFNQMFVAVPVLLIGLSIDYAIHVFMRHRERRAADGITGTVDGSMGVALAGVGVALLWVTATTVIGFLSNLISPIAPIREFGVVSSFGILSALLVFGALVPAAKVEIDGALEARGFDRRKRAFGTGSGSLGRVLSVGAIAARRAPLVVLLAVLLVTAGGVYGASQVDTSFDEEDFLAEEPPDWMAHLPAGFSPGEYHAKEDLEFVNENFGRADQRAHILVQGNVTDDELLTRIDDARDGAADGDATYVLPTGEADVDDPLSTMEAVAATNESFNESFTDADTTGDGVPDENLEELYDELFAVDDVAAGEVIYRTADGEYEAVQLIVSIRGDADSGEATGEMRALADSIEGANGDGANAFAGTGASGSTAPPAGDRFTAIATGGPVVDYVVEEDLFSTVLESLLISLVAVFGFLALAYRLTGNSATLGAVTLLPVALVVAWILGTMALVGMPFNVLTGMITSLTIGLGVAYSIHVSARYTLELDRHGNVWEAMATTVTGTGGALLGSAATTVGGFGTLALAILPVLRQFGIITGLTIAYAFFASVIVLPTLLLLWTRFFGPDVSYDYPMAQTTAPAASDGGRERTRSNGADQTGEAYERPLPEDERDSGPDERGEHE